MKLAFQGEPGAYGHEAARRLARAFRLSPDLNSHDVGVVPCRTFREVLERVASSAPRRERGEEGVIGLVPVENSLTGSLHEVYDLLLEFAERVRLQIVGEVEQPIEHKLLGLPGASLDAIERVYSHPQALWQCRRFLDELGVETQAFYDTAGAARWVAQQRHKGWAAIAGPLAAELYGLVVLREGISDYPHNATRFWAVARPNRASQRPLGGAEKPDDAPGPWRWKWKTSLVLELPHVPGALYRALKIFAEHDVNLTKLESRPVRTEPWRYRFYLDFEGSLHGPSARAALQKLSEYAQRLRVLGSYPVCEGPP